MTSTGTVGKHNIPGSRLQDEGAHVYKPAAIIFSRKLFLYDNVCLMGLAFSALIASPGP